MCSVTFYNFDGTILSSDDLLYGTEIALPQNPSKMGYVFNGWKNYSVNMKITDDIEFYGIWVHEGNGHEYVTTTIVPTCTSEGYDKHVCSICGDEYHDNYKDKLVHQYGDWIIETKVSCKKNGLKYHICNICKERAEEIIESTGHSYQVNEEQQATCTHTGHIIYKCKYCNDLYKEITPVLPHQYEKVMVKKKELDWLLKKLPTMFYANNGDEIFYYRCSDCGYIMTYDDSIRVASASSQKCNHGEGEWELGFTSSCNYGLWVKICSKCLDVIEAKIGFNIDNHDYGEWIDENPPSCGVDGCVGHYHCSKCDKNYDSNFKELLDISILALQHSLEHTEHKRPTAEEEGNMEHWYCKQCDSYYSDKDAKNKIAKESIILKANYVTWSVDGKETKEIYEYGEIPSFKGSTDKLADSQYTYKFDGWDKSITSVTGDITYTATYTPTYINYTVKFLDYDNSEISSKSYHYGDKVTVPSNPSRAADDTYTYAFAGWDKTVVDCAGDATYTATYTPTKKYVLGSVSGGDKVTSADAILLLRHTLFPSKYSVNQATDFNGDGKEDSADAIWLLRHTLFPSKYPLHDPSQSPIQVTLMASPVPYLNKEEYI